MQYLTKRLRVGFLSGAYNPFHLGHAAIIKSFIQSSIVDELWISITPCPPNKPFLLENYDERKKIAQSYLKPYQKQERKIQITTIEEKLALPNYTYLTLKALIKIYHYAEFYLCLGEDQWRNIESWFQWQKLAFSFPILVAPRSNYIYPSQQYHRKIPSAQIRFIPHQHVAISSSDIRERICQGKDFHHLVPQECIPHFN